MIYLEPFQRRECFDLNYVDVEQIRWMELLSFTLVGICASTVLLTSRFDLLQIKWKY